MLQDVCFLLLGFGGDVWLLRKGTLRLMLALMAYRRDLKTVDLK